MALVKFAKIKAVALLILAFVLESEFLTTVITGVLGVLAVGAIITLVITFWGLFKFLLGIAAVLLVFYWIGNIILAIINS